MVGEWQLPAKFVNQQTNYSSTCTTYVENDTLLQNTNTTSCWFYDGTGGTVGVGLNLLFNNGQSVNVAAAGSITVYRPTIWVATNYPTPYYTIDDTNDLTCKLKLGKDDGSGNGDMQFEVDINSKYGGQIGLTQLITAYYSNPANWFSVERCDGTEFYDGPRPVTVSTNSSLPYNGFTSLDDGPSDIWVEPNFVTLSCRDFVRFAPNGGIYVTLGIVTWNTDGTAEFVSPPSNWGITSQYTSPPIGPDGSDQFPVWNINQGGMH
jgi:hypothetical protein